MIKGYYFITDSGISRKGNVSDVKNAVRAGVKVIQYRNKNIDSGVLYREALKLRKIVKKAVFLINDRADIALAVGADGVHIGQSDLPYEKARKILGKNKIIGVTAHNVKEAMAAERAGADYLGVSPVFATRTKKDAGFAAGIDIIKKIKKRVKIPVVAIGGINLSNAKSVVDAGADSLCAISAVVTRKDVKREIEKFQALFKERF
ncbi:MAG: thiamine phosphate synthase [Candidatus Omnitrophica bacterium CG12_big_fil_rev_8_21_14_0_65_43_15]|uniref:Thiamine-phosphate synthase n=1 Tax=Candidatus Taenaricola geysiri TaxID=1974752 RepID=A0A2J0LGJ7_9BACT|nr:MAG: thiamine phosphate synthase [Candidatus Omnitrophica bacterium CG03_land_8_20_14_0_80_43_22]PIW65994.1 MAG: thiamine phosphate synthase [Candidatus Omnitrophica bacterium CG12_big_fil_rev_8_21_14_0_65_43_15]